MLQTCIDVVRHDWTAAEIAEIYQSPLMDLIYRAATVHRANHDPAEVQVCRLISIKTGGCPEDCKYCAQSARYQTEVKAEPMLEQDEVMGIARRAKDAGVTRVCMGAAWREVRDNAQFDHVLKMVKGRHGHGAGSCCTLGMLTESQAKRLEEAGLYAYNHTSTPPKNITRRLSRRGLMRIVWRRSRTSARQTSPCAVAGSSDLGKPTTIVSPCCVPL